MALEAGASIPQSLNELRRTAVNVQAVVQTPGEAAEVFAERVLERWQHLLKTVAPPHRFVLGTNACTDPIATQIRQRLARGALGEPTSLGAHELILCGGNATNTEDQGRLLTLAGALVEGHAASRRSVRVLFSNHESPLLNRPQTRQGELPRRYLA